MAHFEHSTIIEADPSKVFALLSNPGAAGNLLPPDYKIAFESEPAQFKKGAEYDFRLSRYGVSVMWGMFIEDVKENTLIKQRQTHGPFLAWSETQRLEPHGQGTLLTDVVEYDVSFGLLGKLLQDLYLQKEMQRFFEYRHRKIQELAKG